MISSQWHNILAVNMHSQHQFLACLHQFDDVWKINRREAARSESGGWNQGGFIMESHQRLSCVPTWSSGTLPKHCSTACLTVQRIKPAYRHPCLHPLNLHFNTIPTIQVSSITYNHIEIWPPLLLHR